MRAKPSPKLRQFVSQSPREEHLTLSRRMLLTQVAGHVLLHCTGPSRVVPDDFWLTDGFEEAA